MNDELNRNSEKVVISILNKSNLEKIKIPVPNTLEQNQIVIFLEKKIKNYQKSIDQQIKKINLLKEYRQSLVSSVVTGKVRISEDLI